MFHAALCEIDLSLGVKNPLSMTRLRRHSVSRGARLRDDRIAEQAATIAAQAAMIAKLAAQVEALLARVTKLEEQARRSSRNSSQPPSSDGPGAPPARTKVPTGRKPGAQEGHDKHERPLIPSDKVNKRVELRPKRCRACSAALSGDDPSPRRHQVFELPRIEPIVEEYVLHSLDCACGVRTTATLPAGVPTGAFGPSVVAMAATLMGVYRLSKRAVPELMRDVFGLSISLGAVVGCQRIASAALAAPLEEARAFVVEQPVKYADETSWREARGKAWLWTVVTATVTVFMIHRRRTAEAAHAILGRARGVLVSDRHGAYNWWPGTKHQFCWAHLVRDFVKISERRSDSERIGKALLAETTRMFEWWHRVRDGTLARATLCVYMRSVRGRVEALLTEAPPCPISRLPGRAPSSSSVPTHSGPSSTSRESSRRTTSPNALFGMACSVAKPVTAPIPKRAVASSNAFCPCMRLSASSSATSSTSCTTPAAPRCTALTRRPSSPHSRTTSPHHAVLKSPRRA